MNHTPAACATKVEMAALADGVDSEAKLCCLVPIASSRKLWPLLQVCDSHYRFDCWEHDCTLQNSHRARASLHVLQPSDCHQMLIDAAFEDETSYLCCRHTGAAP